MRRPSSHAFSFRAAQPTGQWPGGVTMADPTRANRPSEAHLGEYVVAYQNGDRAAAEDICHVLGEPVRLTVVDYLGKDSPDVDDVVQETLLAVVEYLGKDHAFTGNLIKFAVTVARNRCRSLLAWRRRRAQVPLELTFESLPHAGPNALDVYLDRELRETVGNALRRLDPDCRSLLEAFFVEEALVEEIRRRIGLKTVQGVYHRRMICLRKIVRLLNGRLFRSSS